MLFILIVIIAIVVFYNMAKSKTGIFAKKGNCKNCGKEVDSMHRLELNDGSLLCSDCYFIVPKYMFDYARNVWTYEDFQKYLKYIEYSNQNLRSKFSTTASYGNLYIDENNGLFYISHDFISDDKVPLNSPIYEFKNLSSFDFNFNPEKLKQGIFGDKVKGDVEFVYEMENPNFGERFTVSYGESANAYQNFLKTKITYELPDMMKEFGTKFVVAYMKNKPSTENNQLKQDDLTAALNLFMFDTIDEVTEEKLKNQRNLLIKAFHPDENGNIDSKYAAKINNAYKLLEENIVK